MFKKTFAIAIAAACMTSGAAFAQSYDYRNDRGGRGDRVEYQQRTNDHDRRDYRDRRDDRRDAHRGNDYRGNDYRSNDYRSNHYRGNHGYDVRRNHGYDDRYRHTTQRPYYQMRRGERMHQYYSGSQYVVRDWRGHRGLYAPHRGHQWVQVGNDYALVAIATGLIAHVLMNN